MLPPRYSPFLAGRALSLERAGLAGCRPITAQHLAVLFVCTTIGQPLAGGAAIDIVYGDIDEVLLAETSFRLGTRGHRLRQSDRDAGHLAGQYLPARVIPSIGHDIEGLRANLRARLLGHVGWAIRPYIGHLVGDYEMVLGVDRALDIVADNPAAPAARRHRTRIRIGQRNLLVLGLHHLNIERIQAVDLLTQRRNLFLEPRDLGLRNRRALAIGAVELREITGNAFVNLLQAPLHLGLREVLVARVDGLELAPVDGNAGRAEQLEASAQQYKLAADFADGGTVVLAEISDRLEVRRQASRQPDQLDIPLTFPAPGADSTAHD